MLSLSALRSGSKLHKILRATFFIWHFSVHQHLGNGATDSKPEPAKKNDQGSLEDQYALEPHGPLFRPIFWLQRLTTRLGSDLLSSMLDLRPEKTRNVTGPIRLFASNGQPTLTYLTRSGARKTHCKSHHQIGQSSSLNCLPGEGFLLLDL